MDNTGTESIEAISLDMSKIGDIHLNPRVFMKMHKLRFLKFDSSLRDKNKVHVFYGLESVFTKLRYLHWRGSPFKSLSSIFQSENLVKLDMRHSQVEQLWNGSQQLANLKEINLAWSKHLTNCPDLSGAPNLVSLNLSFTSLCEISSSIQHLNKLNDLHLTQCKKLRGLPDCTDLKSLRKLHLSLCSNLKMLPELPCNIEELYLLGSAIEELPSSVKYLSKLVKLDVTSSKKLKSLPNNVSELKSLKHLRLTRCSKLDKLPDEIGTLDSLRYFEAEGTPIKVVPSSIINLNNLQKLSFEGCKGQDMLETNLKAYIPASIKNLSNLQYLDIGYCEALQSLPELPLISTNAYNCISLEVISCLSVPDSFVAIPSSSIKFDLINCFKLDQNVLIEEGLLKIQSLATLWKGHYYDENLRLTPHSTAICFPGSEVPKGFSFRSLGSFITVKLPPCWLNDNFVGFGLCAVVALRDHEDNGAFLDINFECKLKSEDGQWEVSYGTFSVSRTSRSRRKCYKIGSDHVYMGFDSTTIYLDDIDELCYDEAFFQFYLEGPLGKPIECCKVKKCGVRLMYAEDIGKPSGSVNSDDEDEFLDSMEKSISSDDEDEFWESMEEPN
ncbi:hypothetical protein EZV62_014145 [Acer yangbiense]|uniref:Uncharacterized protein n=1 Tax=Acer yangbiense TaxID=1000413 RepID=A0A5C7HTN4_9ROSI|nr:hypothetical protein EZV62_014145 [Acer yangbiense]